MTGVWEAFLAFVQTVLTTADAHPLDDTQRAALRAALNPLCTLKPTDDAVRAVQTFFANVPAHWSAVNGLDHTQFLNPLQIGEHVIHLRYVMEPFSKMGAPVHGKVWLSLVRLAHAAAPEHIQMEACQSFLCSQMQPVAAVQSIKPPLPGQLESVMANIMGAFPGLQECMNHIMSPNPAAGPDDLNSVVDRVQDVLVRPLLENLRASNPNAPDISPAIGKILEGFRGLNTVVGVSNTSDVGMET
jgi:hypothetical protein